jgi:hypothetical protein
MGSYCFDLCPKLLDAFIILILLFKYLQIFRVFNEFTIGADCYQRLSNFLIDFFVNDILELLFSLNLFIENAKSYISKVGYIRDFFIEKNFLVFDANYHISLLLILGVVGYFIGKIIRFF